MTQYLYPQNLTAKATIWLWGMRDFIILVTAAILSVVALVQFGWFIPAALTLCFAFLTIRKEEITVWDYMKCCVRYFLSTQQYFQWR